MIYINFIEPTDENWSDWKSRCKKATEELIKCAESGEEIEITDLYKETKSIFFKHDEYFFGKCAYCESLISATHPGDIEHFRPKGKVTDINNKPIMIKTKDIEVHHPGYYWLAYELSNLLPACEDCNRPSSGNSMGKKIGKWMKFPVNGMRACKPSEEVLEDPLLINPVIEDPEEHLEIDNLGFLSPKNNSERGKTCIDVFGLNDRSSLIEERKRTYRRVNDELNLLWIALKMKSTEIQERIVRIEEYKNGERPYSIAGRKAINDEKETSRLYREML